MKTKQEYREYYNKLRKTFDRCEINEVSQKIEDNLFAMNVFQHGSVLTYVSFRQEVITGKIIDRLLEEDRTVYVPYCKKQEKNLGWAKINDRNKDLAKGTYGILEPRKELRGNSCLVEEIDLVLVPGIVFTRAGNRIGYGGGYYDRLLSKLGSSCLTIGLTYDKLLVEKLPVEKHDRRVDYIVTEREIVCCRSDEDESI